MDQQINQIVQTMTTMMVMSMSMGMIRPIVLQQEGKLSEPRYQINKSISEEEDAVKNYSYRSKRAKAYGLDALEQLYLHIKGEEEQHLAEFKKAREALVREAFLEP